MLVQTINIHKFLLIDEKSPRPFELASGIHIQLPPRLIEVGYSLKELLSVLVEVVGVVFGVGVEVVLRAEVPVASVPAVVATSAVESAPAVIAAATVETTSSVIATSTVKATTIVTAPAVEASSAVTVSATVVASAPSEGPVNHGSQSAAVKNVEDGEKSPERVDVVRF